MKSQTLLLLIVLFLFEKKSTAQTLNGNWKGTSLCQIRNSPYHDEIVVYHILWDSGPNSYLVSASKTIDRKEDDMETSNFSFDPDQKILFLVDSVSQSKWEFKVTGTEMHGTLIYKGKF